MPPRYEKMPLHEESERAPTGVCELSIQGQTYKALSHKEELKEKVHEYVDPNFDVEAYDQLDDRADNRLVVFTGTDRLDIASVRDIAEVYGQVLDYKQGNIPPELSLVPTSNEFADQRYFAWLEFKLEMELPARKIEESARSVIPDIELTPKNPVGENMEAIVYRNHNVANHQVRDIVNHASQLRDALPIEYIRVVCEGVEQ